MGDGVEDEEGLAGFACRGFGGLHQGGAESLPAGAAMHEHLHELGAVRLILGLTLTAATLYRTTGFTADTAGREIMVIGLVQGFGMGLVFIPLSTVAFVTLPAQYRTDGTAMLTLVRNVASSVGISVVIANLSSKTTVFHSQLAEHITPFNGALQSPDVTRWLDLATDQGRALIDQMLTMQAAVMAYASGFLLLTAICALSIPFVFAIGSTASLRGRKMAVQVVE